MLPWQRLIVTETEWSANLKIFIIRTFTEKCLPTPELDHREQLAQWWACPRESLVLDWTAVHGKMERVNKHTFLCTLQVQHAAFAPVTLRKEEVKTVILHYSLKFPATCRINTVIWQAMWPTFLNEMLNGMSMRRDGVGDAGVPSLATSSVLDRNHR